MGIFEEVENFYESYGGEKLVYGYSEEGRPLYALRAGHGETLGISQYAIHAREWITTLLGLEHIRRGVRKGSVWFLPLTNPDGVLLATEGIGSVSADMRDFLLKIGNFPLWKANAHGVDLNVNFPAKWGHGVQNRREPSSESFIGNAPLCAKESRALAEFTLKTKPRFTLSWHTKGEEIYWRFHQPPLRLKRDKKFAKVLSQATGYPLKEEKGRRAATRIGASRPARSPPSPWKSGATRSPIRSEERRSRTFFKKISTRSRVLRKCFSGREIHA